MQMHVRMHATGQTMDNGDELVFNTSLSPRPCPALSRELSGS